MDPYRVLGVSPKASRSEVTEAYRTLVQIFHPDRHQSSSEAVRAEVERQMKQLNEAYAVVRGRLPPPGKNGSDAVGGGRPSGIANIRSAALWVGTAPGSWARTARQAGTPGPTKRLDTPEARQRVARLAWEIDAKARITRETRAQEERTTPRGDARARPRGSTSPGSKRSVLAGLGQALHTNELRCTGCRGLQRLPRGWQASLDTTEFVCSSCGRLILSR